MQTSRRRQGQRGQSLIELICLMPLYILLLIVVVQLTAMYFSVFTDFSDVRNDALKQGIKAEGTSTACFEKRSRHSILLGLNGPTDRPETKVRIYAYGNGPSNCPG